MAAPERDTVYTNDGTNRTVYSKESNATGWFVGIIVALALLAIGYLVFSANNGPATPTTSVDVNNTPAVTAPVETAPAPMVEAPAVDTTTTPSVTAPADPAAETTAPAADATTPAPAAEAPVDGAATTTEPAPVQ